MTDPTRKTPADPRERRDARAQAVRRVVIHILWLNLLVAVTKAVYGLMSGSLAVGTDAIHSLLDASANVIGVVALRLAVAPPDREHPYGHSKIEIVAAAMIGVAIAGAGVKFAWSAVEALWGHRAPPDVSALGFALVGGTWVVNMAVATYEARRGRELKSNFLIADAAHTASDVAVTAAVLASMAGARFGLTWADPAGALVILLVIARVAWRILASNIPVLVDHAVIDAETVEKLVLGVTGVRGCHRVRSRGTEDIMHIDLHILLDGDLPLRRAHEIAHEVEQTLRRDFPAIADVTIHMEPEEDGDEPL